jgi:hypothetical protein
VNDADVFFGTKEPTEMPPAQPTHFARYPDVQTLCDVFLEEMDWNNDAYTVQHVVSGARDFVLAIGNDPKLLLHTIKKMKLEKLNISSPRSCITLARNITPDADSEASRQKYVWEVDDET